MLIHLNLARCGVTYLTNLPLLNLLSLDLRDNRLTTVDLDVLARLRVLTVLLLAGNPLTSAFLAGPSTSTTTTPPPGVGGAAAAGIPASNHTTASDPTSSSTSAVYSSLAGRFSSPADPIPSTLPASAQSDPPRTISTITLVDVSRTFLADFDVNDLRVFPSLVIVNLSHSGLRRVQGAGFVSLPQLSVLDLRGCPLAGFSRDVFVGVDQLSLVYADDYKLCCRQVLPASTLTCLAPSDLFSSCTRLIGRNSHRVALCTYAAVTLVINLLSLLAHSRLSRPFCQSSDTPPPPRQEATSLYRSIAKALVQQLAVSDFLRGVQLGVTSVADYVHGDDYLGRDGAWRHSAACRVSGFLALLSGEVSTLLVFLLTLHNVLALRRPPSSLHRPSQAVQPLARSFRLVCCLVWSWAGLVALTPLLPGPAGWGVYSHSALCLPLPFSSRGDGPGWDFSFGVTVVFNALLLLLVCAGQVFIGATLPEQVYFPAAEEKASSCGLSSNSSTSGAFLAREDVTGSDSTDVTHSSQNDLTTTSHNDPTTPATNDVISPSINGLPDQIPEVRRSTADNENHSPVVRDTTCDKVERGPSNDVKRESGSVVTNASREDIIHRPRNLAASRCKELRSTGRAKLLSLLQLLCWLPVWLISVTSHDDPQTADRAFVALAVFVLPLSSALSPLLYALAIRQEKKRLEEEQQFIKHILARRLAHGKVR